jgi:hypothetical protein
MVSRMVYTRPTPNQKNDNKYLVLWTVRSFMLAGMHRAGVSRLRGEHDIRLSEFAVTFPDANGWCTRLRSRGQYSTLGAFFASLGYDGRPELFSMFACLLLTTDMQVNPGWLQSSATQLRRAMRELQSVHGIDQLPAICVKKCLGVRA